MVVIGNAIVIGIGIVRQRRRGIFHVAAVAVVTVVVAVVVVTVVVAVVVVVTAAAAAAGNPRRQHHCDYVIRAIGIMVDFDQSVGYLRCVRTRTRTRTDRPVVKNVGCSLFVVRCSLLTTDFEECINNNAVASLYFIFVVNAPYERATIQDS